MFEKTENKQKEAWVGPLLKEKVERSFLNKNTHSLSLLFQSHCDTRILRDLAGFIRNKATEISDSNLFSVVKEIFWQVSSYTVQVIIILKICFI